MRVNPRLNRFIGKRLQIRFKIAAVPSTPDPRDELLTKVSWSPTAWVCEFAVGLPVGKYTSYQWTA